MEYTQVFIIFLNIRQTPTTTAQPLLPIKVHTGVTEDWLIHMGNGARYEKKIKGKGEERKE